MEPTLDTKGRSLRVACSLEMKASLADNTLRGAASTTGNMDRTGDVILPGAFKKTLASFLANGFVAVGHDWDGLPVAMPTSAKEVGNQLVCEAKFHSTDEAQDARTVCMERLEAGLSVGLSIGFMIDWNEGYAYFPSGKELLDWCKESGYDMSLFDVKGITAYKGFCRAIKNVAELFEFSIVTVPANPNAIASDVKSAPAVDSKSTSTSEAKSQTNTVGAILQAKIHQSFTVAADELAIRGYMDVEERIGISSCIGDCLKGFAAALDPTVSARPVDSDDVDWIASKTISGGGMRLADHLDQSLADLAGLITRLEGYKSTKDEDGRRVSADRLAQFVTLRDRLSSLIGASQPSETPAEDLAMRALRMRAARLIAS